MNSQYRIINKIIAATFVEKYLFVGKKSGEVLEQENFHLDDLIIEEKPLGVCNTHF